jgi:hypothetical protein
VFFLDIISTMLAGNRLSFHLTPLGTILELGITFNCVYAPWLAIRL